MKNSIAAFLLLAMTNAAMSQEKTDPWLDSLIRSQASPFLLNVLNQPDTFQYQFIYTKIDRDKNNKPHFRNYYLHVDKNRYFNPASMVKLPTALLALEKINKLKEYGVDKYSTMLTDSAYDRQTKVVWDSTSEDGMPSVAHYVKKIFLVSDNDAYNRLYEFVGQQTLNERLWKMGYKEARITRRFVTMTEDQNRHTNPVRFKRYGELLYIQPPANNERNFDFSKKIFVGRAHYNRQDSLINSPMDFTTHNNFPLEYLQQIMQAVMFPDATPSSKRFKLTPEDYRFLYQYMSEKPSESEYPSYDTSEYFDSYTKFFFFKANRGAIPPGLRSFNKTGWSYGFLTDACYIVDLKNNVEFMLSGTIYTNKDGVLNDDKYEYEQTGYPWFKEMGTIIYNYELQRPRTIVPDLNEFILQYK